MDPDAPLVITLALPPDVQDRLDAARARWFPAGRTAVGAHITLFHAVPGGMEADVRADLAAHAAGGVPLRISGVTSLGRGAAYSVESAELARRHHALQQQWWPYLTRQDRQSLRAHVTVQNKVEPRVARETVAALQAGFAAYEVDAVGYDVWRYEGGPWTHLVRIPFTPTPV